MAVACSTAFVADTCCVGDRRYILPVHSIIVQRECIHRASHPTHKKADTIAHAARAHKRTTIDDGMTMESCDSLHCTVCGVLMGEEVHGLESLRSSFGLC